MSLSSLMQPCKVIPMQLESSMFGIFIVQLKPQLEVLLGLPEGALTKEIKLTQDLMSLFVSYQIPSNLLTYDGPDAAAICEKVDSVKGNVKAVLDMIKRRGSRIWKRQSRRCKLEGVYKTSPALREGISSSRPLPERPSRFMSRPRITLRTSRTYSSGRREFLLTNSV
jgi:hypothetical protein